MSDTAYEYLRMLEVTIEQARALERGEVPDELRELAGVLARTTSPDDRREIYGYVALQRYDAD